MKAPITFEHFDWKENEEFPFTLSSLMISPNAVLFKPNFEIHIFFKVKVEPTFNTEFDLFGKPSFGGLDKLA